jgi:catechol 2,3-dioxygenase-like lactoylglutathione lyase family enzyme
MIDHTGIEGADIDRSAAFYAAALGALGMHRAAQSPDDTGIGGIGYGYDDFPFFWIDRYHPHAVRQHTAFVARSRDGVDAFHAAMEEGGAR